MKAADLQARVDEVGWYHTLEFSDGVSTNGMFDLRPYVDRYGLPARMDGMRALDIGTWDGFWAFEMERRGAQVIAIDLDDERALDWPPRRRPQSFPERPRGSGFRLAKELYNSKVERIVCSVYDADPADLGTFDLVFCGAVLVHLRDQIRALERIARLCKGTYISAEDYEPLCTLMPFSAARFRAIHETDVVFWRPGRRAWRRMIWAAGFDHVREHAHFKERSTAGWKVPHVIHHASGSILAGQNSP